MLVLAQGYGLCKCSQLFSVLLSAYCLSQDPISMPMSGLSPHYYGSPPDQPNTKQKRDGLLSTVISAICTPAQKLLAPISVLFSLVGFHPMFTSRSMTAFWIGLGRRTISISFTFETCMVS